MKFVLNQYRANFRKDPEVSTPWFDIWITFRPKGKFRKETIVGTLQTADCLVSELCLDRRIAREARIRGEVYERDEEWEEGLQRTLQEIADKGYSLTALPGDSQGSFIDHHVTTNATEINREEAEKMVRFLLEKLGYKNPKLVWKKVKRSVSAV